MLHLYKASLVLAALGGAALPVSPLKSQSAKAMPASIQRALARAGANQSALRAAWNQTPPEQREGMRFLLENMPDRDLQTLSASFLREQTALAYTAMNSAPWRDSVAKNLFLNDVLPYACLNEARDGSRAQLRRLSLPLIADCKTPGEAAQKLNAKLFPLVNVRYSTERKRPDQNPTETMASGKATCSGLSILLVEACRSVGIPARVVGTPLWANMRGNHTWVEIWDGERWRFTGAAEPDAQGLDHGWFVQDASQAQKDAPQHAIYASSFRRTGLAFPLVWAPGIQWVPAENVTDRYAAKSSVTDSSKTRLLVSVQDAAGKRVPARVTLREAGKSAVLFSGTSRGETADRNDYLAFAVPRGCPPRHYELTAAYGGKTVTGQFDGGTSAEETVVVRTNGTLSLGSPLLSLLKEVFGSDTALRDTALNALATVAPDETARQQAWQDYKASPLHAPLKAEWEKKTVTSPDRSSPYQWRFVGTKPADGWALVIAMHGGGGAPKEVNDGEWEHMFKAYYREHPEASGYVYLALRAPNDTWNGFYDDAICPLVENLIRQFVLFSEVNPNKVYALGASHGGYGAFVIGPKIPYRFAAVHAAASAPTDGETKGENLQSLPFTITTGALDNGYGRIDRDRKFMQAVEGWRKQYGGYNIALTAPEGVGHLVPDHDELASLLRFKRNAAPKKVVWTQSDTVLKRFYWLEALTPVESGHIEANVSGNTITLKAEQQDKIALWLDASLVDLAKPVTIELDGGPRTTFTPKPNLKTYCQGLLSTGDPYLSAPVRVVVNLRAKMPQDVLSSDATP